MSKIEANTIDSISGTSTLTLGSSNASTIALGSGDVQSNFLYPAFHAQRSSDQSFTNDTYVKIQFDTESIDTNNCYDNSSNYRFTPTIAGKYYIYVSITGKSTNNLYATRLALYKNGSAIRYAIDTNGTNASYPLNEQTPYIGMVVDMNGSSDYLEGYVNIQTHNGSSVDSNANGTYFGGYRIGT
tara:strand:+ start:51 stop:605 length:555 start_codon:yes stop_codon:yes gene_type:complete